MDDLEAMRLCAEAMGIKHRVIDNIYIECKAHVFDSRPWISYNPLHDDAQAMALVKRLRLTLSTAAQDSMWAVIGSDEESYSEGPDLNRAIVYCVAKMQAAKKEKSDAK